MTSSKSFRASMLPSSRSAVFRSNTEPEPASNASGASPKRTWHKSSTIDLSQLRDAPPSTSPATGPARNTPGPRGDAVPRSDTNYSDSSEPQPLRKKDRRKSKTWSNRLSSFLPSLILPTTEPVPAVPKQQQQQQQQQQQSHQQQSHQQQSQQSQRQQQLQPQLAPVVTFPSPTLSPAPTKNSDPSDDSVSSSSPSIIEPTIRLAGNPLDNAGIVAQPSRQTPPQSGPPSPARTPVPDYDYHYDMAMANPQIVVPLPPPATEPSRGRLSKPEPPTMAPPPPPPEVQLPRIDSGGDGSLKSSKLRKDMPEARRRSGSLQHLANESVPNLLMHPRTGSPGNELRGRRSSSTQSPTARNSNSKQRMSSTPLSIRPGSSQGEVSQSPTRGRLRRSWMPGGRSRSNSVDVSNTGSSYAWVLSDDNHAEYNVSFLKNAEKVPELWNEGGSILVYLQPKSSGCGPSFKVPEFTISASFAFNDLIQAEREGSIGHSRGRSFGGRDSLSVEDASRLGSPELFDDAGELKLYIPAAPPSGAGQLSPATANPNGDLDRLIAVRNLFAFLTGQPLVATKTRPTSFHAFLQIAAVLQEFNFVGLDGASFGDAVDLSFSFYMDQLGLADCRHSREKTLEALVLGERMRCTDLYNEAFAHAAGKYSAIMDLRLPLFEQITPHTRQALEKAHYDLVQRQHNANLHLEQFEFPALFSGIANSTSVPEIRKVGFKVWKSSFARMRSFVLGHYKSSLGSWPPKASSKKNAFTESGLNRLVLKILYSDMCAMYDLLVDRTNQTTRIMDEVPAISTDPSKMTMSALRNIMSEFDRSKPPVLPPVPYDCPQLPTPASILETYNTMPIKKQAKFDKKIKEHELILILNKGYNYDTNAIKLPFLDAFKSFELREARGKSAQEMADQRIGYWLFMYVTIQSLPVLVVDAPGIHFTDGVEYFLCNPPMGNPPWVGDRQVRKMWYEVAGGGGLVELSTDAVLFSIEATYHRSHCWLAAKQWEGHGDEPTIPQQPPLSPLEPPRNIFPGSDDFQPPPPTGGPGTPSPPLGGPQVALRPRTHSPGGSRANQAWRSSIALGLEPVPLQPPNPFGERSSSLGNRPASAHIGLRSQSVGNLAAMNYSNPMSPSSVDSPSGATFDDILGGGGGDKAKPKKKKGFF